MRRSNFLTVLTVLLGGVALWWLTDTLAPPEPASAPVEEAPPAPVPAEPMSAARTETGNGSDGTDDVELRAALNGFVGRVVDAGRRPVGNCDVRLFRGALDDALPDALAAFADARVDAQRCLAGATRTNADGTFRIDGVWPRGLYLVLAGLDTATPAHRLLTHAAAPGELVDLGDIWLGATAAVTGTVVDQGGAPIANALVRGVDLPAALLAEYPFELVDPDGALLLRWPDAPMRVFELSAAAKALLAQLPIPTTRTDRDGAFRLVGLAPGKSTIAVTRPGCLSAIAGDVTLQPGQVQALGRIELRRGEELSGRVVDTDGKPVEGAEVLAGSTQGSWPVDPLRRLGVTDAEGRFRASGFAAGNVTIAARRSARDPWFVAAPQPARGERVVALPAAFALTVRVTTAAGALVRAPQLRVVGGQTGGAGALQALGMTAALDLHGRRVDLADGRVRIDDLPAGDYVVFAIDAAATSGSAAVALAADTEATIELAARNEYRVRVVGPDERPIRGAAIYVAGLEQGLDRAFCAGRTDADGLVVTQTGSADVTVSADHPRWGCVHGVTTAGEGELLLRMQPPGRLEGTLREHGRPPPATCAVRVLHQPDVRGPLQPLPVLVAPGPDGGFALPALQPGRYEVAVVRTPTQATSAGGMLALWLALSEPEASAHQIVEVQPGATARLDLDLGAGVADALPGAPTAHVCGTVQVDGSPAAGFPVALQAGNAQRTTEVDAAGRFDFGPVPAGDVTVRVLAPGVTLLPRRELCTRQLRLQAGEKHALELAIAFVALGGTVVRDDGSPVEGATVIASTRGIFHSAPTGPDGAFAFPGLPAGVYRIDAHHQSGLRGALVDVHTDGEAHVAGLRIVLQAATRVAGRIDTSGFGGRAEHVGLSFLAEDAARPEGTRLVAWVVAQEDGTFATDDLVPGTYRLHVHARLDTWQEYEATAPIEVPAQGVRDLHVQIAPRANSPRR